MQIPLKFVNSLDVSRHILLFYSDPEYAKKIEFQFIENGLAREEHCIYATAEDPTFVREKMEEYGIRVNDFIKREIFCTSTKLRIRLGIKKGY